MKSPFLSLRANGGRGRRSQRHRVLLNVEQLEDRLAPAGTPALLGTEFRVDPAGGSPGVTAVATNATDITLVAWVSTPRRAM